MYQLVIFDMDGLLVNTEPLWEDAEIAVFARHGVAITRAMCEKVKGFRVSETVEHYRRQFSTITQPTEQYVQEIIEQLKQLIINEIQLLPGVRHALNLCRNNGLKLAVASSSSMELIRLNLEQTGIIDAFDLLISGENEPYGKPHPGIFLTTARAFNVAPEHCLVFEDSLNGVIAAKAARMTVIAVPEANNRNNPKFAIADRCLESLEELDEGGIL